MQFFKAGKMMRLAKYEHLMLTGVFSVDDGDKQRITNEF